jgi:hypothetical protein
MTGEDRWIEYAEFRGETIAAMKAINRELKEIKQNQKEIKSAFNKHYVDYNDIKIKMAGLAGAVSMLTSIVILVIGSVV